jgi:hypothetical protein
LKYHPKQVEQFPDINKLCNVASCWIFIGILLEAHPILHISRIRVKKAKCTGCSWVSNSLYILYSVILFIVTEDEDTITSAGGGDEDNDDDKLKAIKQFF